MFPPKASRLLAALAIACVPLLGACGADSGGDSNEAAVPRATEAEIVMQLVAFKPADLEVESGTTVTWTQRDTAPHTVTSGSIEQGSAGVTQQPDGRFDSGRLAAGETFEHTFEEPGTYPFFCSLHPATMRGEIRVT